ncbi:hypothetical protein [Sphaerisporangium sp. TRM90804]|uniref:hypothetical protein n=1 Tax=Sphaerisporangium sp. TRM90804 TaxID=3031113 RepID=UPI00244B683A|nr:hypothetical protein [Sphaerisporangium sp. TRM90804]MDH2430854.1 hypothetical protein [Sphaerisporangium sp. TRM90804]
MMLRGGPLAIAGLLLVSGCGDGAAISRAELDDLRVQGVEPGMVYVVDLPGYELARRSMSGYNDEGFQAYYVSPRDGRVWLGVDHGFFSDGLCPEKPVHDAERLSAPVSCDRDEVGWYRRSGERHEYAVSEEGHVLRLAGRRGEVSRAALRQAVAGARAVAGAGGGG